AGQHARRQLLGRDRLHAPGLARLHRVEEGAVEPHRAEHVRQRIGAHVLISLAPDARLRSADVRSFTRPWAVGSVAPGVMCAEAEAEPGIRGKSYARRGAEGSSGGTI